MRRTAISRILSLVFAVFMAVSMFALTGCGSKKNSNELWITFFKGGYGDEWAYKLADKFMEENEGVVVKVTPDSQLINAVPNMMKNGTNYDLIFCHDIAWEDFVNPGTVYCLDELYATEVESGVTFADRIWDEDVLDSCSYPDINGEEHYYKVPWTIGTAGIAYNLTVMDRIDDWLGKSAGQTYLSTVAGGGDTSRRWNRTAPETYYDLWQYCVDVTSARLRVDEFSNDYVVPFIWSGQEEEWQWDYVVFDWWGQLAGPETMNTFKNFGDVKEDFTLDWDKASLNDPNKEVYNPALSAVERNEDGTISDSSTFIGWKEFEDAYKLWYNLVALNKDWSHSKVGDYSKDANEHGFSNGYAAMTPSACWVEYESKNYLETSGQEISLMPTPIISHVRFDNSGKVLLKSDAGYAGAASTELDAIHATAEEIAAGTAKTINSDVYRRVSFTSSFGDSVLIPQKATSKDLAVEFILFMQREDNAQLFTAVSGGTVLPYKYDYAGSFEAYGMQPTAWQQSIFEINKNSIKFNNYTKHPMMRQTLLKGTAKMTSVWPENNYYYYKAWSNPSSYSPSSLISSIYSDDVDAMWATYKRLLA